MQRYKKKKTHLRFLITFLSLSTIFLLRHQLFEWTFPLFLDDTISYQKIEWSEGRPALINLHVETKSYVFDSKKIEMGCAFDLLELYFEPHLICHEARLKLLGSDNPSTLPLFLFPTSHLAIKLQMEEALLDLGTQGFSFDYDGYESKLTVFQTRESPLFSLSFFVQETNILADLQMRNAPLLPVLQLASSFYPSLAEGWEHVDGKLSVQAGVEFSHGLDVKALNVNVQTEGLSLSNSSLGIHSLIEKGEGDFIYPSGKSEDPFWKQFLARLTLKGGEFLFQESWGLSHIDAQIDFDPELDPAMQLTALLKKDEKEFPLHLESRGSLHDDQRFWLEMDLKLDPLESFISICSFEKDAYVIESHLKNIDPYHVELVQDLLQSHDLKLLGGLMEGKVTAWIENNQLSRLQAEEIVAQNVQFQLPLQNCGGLIEELKGAVQASFDGNWRLANAKMGIKKGDLLIHGKEIAGVSLDLSIAEENQQYGIAGLAKVDGESVEFGCSIQEGLCENGWYRIETLNAKQLTPFLPKEMSLKGELDLFGTFDHESLECYVQGAKLLFSHPLFDGYLPSLGIKDSSINTEGRAFFTYDWKKEEWRGFVPLTGAILREKHTATKIENIQGMLCLDEGHIILDAELKFPLGGQASIQDFVIHLDFDALKNSLVVKSHQGKLLIEDQIYEIALQNFQLQGPEAIFDLKLYQQKEEAAHFYGKAQIASDIQCAFGKKSHLFNKPLNIASCVLSPDFTHIALQLNPEMAKIRAEKLNQEWKVEAVGADFQLRMTAASQEGGWKIPAFALQSQGFYFDGEGQYQSSQKLFLLQVKNCQGSLKELELTVKNQAPLKVRFSPQSGIVAHDIQLVMQGKVAGQLSFEELSYDLEKWKMQKGKFLLTSTKLQGEFEGEFNPKELRSSLSGSSQFNETPFYFTLQTDSRAPELLGSLTLFDHPKAQGLKVLFKNSKEKGLSCASLQGQFRGMNMQFEKIPEKNGLRGSLTGDLSLTRLFFPDAPKLGKGYTLKGDLILDQEKSRFLAVFKGDNFEFLDYTFENGSANIDLTMNRVVLSNLKIKDKEMAVNIPTFNCEKSPEGKWKFAIPSLRLENFTPNKEKPFCIRSLNLDGFSGQMDDKASLTASGHLIFSNATESAFYLTPIEMIKDIGLDPGILTPIQGEIDLHLKEGKFFFTALRDVFSESRRSEFYLSETPSYVDLEGNMQIALKMKQNVLLKITEMFTLSIGGTLSQPQYGLQFN